MEATPLIVLSIAIILFAGLTYLFIVRPGIKRYENQLLHLATIPIDRGEERRSILKEHIINYNYLADSAKSIRLQVRSMPFPIPSKHAPLKTGEEMMQDSLSVLQNNALGAVAAEQFVLMIFPPEQIGKCLLMATDTLLSHATVATAENLLTLKSSLLDGLMNIQDPEILKECLKEFAHAIFEQLKEVNHVNSLLDAIDHHHALNIVHSFVNWHTVSHGLEPAFHLHQSIKSMTDSWIDHAVHAKRSIVQHAHIVPHLGGHIPIITLVISSVREIRLLHNKKTDVESSLKNIALDAVGVGGGALIGGKIGAFLGSVVPVVGTLVGAGVGAAVGGMIGKMGSNKVKKIPLKEAFEAYQTSHNSMQNGMRNVAVNCVHEIRKTGITAKRAYFQRIEPVPVADPQKMAGQVKAIADTEKKSILAIENELSAMQHSLFLLVPHLKRTYLELTEKLQQRKRAIPAENQINETPIVALSLLLEKPLLHSVAMDEALNGAMELMSEQNSELSSLMVLWALNAGNEYNKTVNYTMGAYAEQAEIFKDEASSWVRTINQKLADVQQEKEKLGMA